MAQPSGQDQWKWVPADLRWSPFHKNVVARGAAQQELPAQGHGGLRVCWDSRCWDLGGFPPPALGTCAAVLVLLALRGQRRWHRARARRNELRRRAERKRAQRDDLRAQAKDRGLSWEAARAWAAERAAGCAPPASVVEMTAAELLAAMARGELSSEYVTRCFVGRAMAVGEALDMNAEEPFAAAVEEAAACDRERAEGRVRGPLHGLPISVKDQFDQRGMDSTCGLSVRCGQPLAEDGLLVSLLREQGAIPFVRTNIPQALMLPESFNAIWGTARNPHDPSRTVGGSSGGEAGLLAARGSPLGIGTDIGGSIRIPAVLCGVVGLKPTVGRVSAEGLSVARPGGVDGQNAIKSSAGPMGRCVADLALIMEGWCRPRMYDEDSSLPQLPWDGARYARARDAPRLRFGVFDSDGYFDTAPACARAVREAAEAVRRAGHEVVEFKPLEMYKGSLSFVSLLSADGSLNGMVSGLEGEALHPSYSFLYRVASMPKLLRSLLAPLLRGVLGQPRTADMIQAGCAKSTREYWQVVGERDRLRKQLLARWKEAGIDVLLCPGLAVPAFPHGLSVKLNQACSYTFVWNNLNFPAGVLPVGTVQAGEEAYVERTFRDGFSKVAVKACKGSAGLPVSVQVVAPPWCEELCLGAMHAVERSVGFKMAMPRHAPPL